jgi:hypothetical protein
MNDIRCFISQSLIGLSFLSAAALNMAMFANSATAETITGTIRQCAGRNILRKTPGIPV